METQLAAPLRNLALTTATAAPTDVEQDPEDCAVSFNQAMTTTLTESLGDHEADPDDDVAAALRVLCVTTTTKADGEAEEDRDDELLPAVAATKGSIRPLGFRFAEPGMTITLDALRYDHRRQRSILSDGSCLIDSFRNLPPG